MNGVENHSETRRREETTQSEDGFQVAVSLRFLVTSLLASCLLAFCVGRAARIAFLVKEGVEQCDGTLPPHSEPALPAFVARNGRKIPQSRYLSKNFDISMSASSSSWLAASRDKVTLLKEEEDGGGDSSCTENDDENCIVESDEEPMAEHLMVDIRNVDGSFLKSERRLANAMLEVIDEAKLMLLSYHCHGIVPRKGVSCVGILEKNYFSFHTWPEDGVITLDLCVGGYNSLISMVPMIERVFSVPRSHVDKPVMIWARKIRGYPQEGATDLDVYVLHDLGAHIKEQVATVKTDFQTIDVYDYAFLRNETINEYGRKAMLSQDAQHSVSGRPERIVFLDGMIQSTAFREAAYHEALVHPALFTHVNPKRVAIIGGGEGATLRDVLKHNTVEEAVMIEIDEKMVDASRQYIPEWSDCSDLEGSASWCVKDPRASVYYQDAFAWFVDQYASGDEETRKSAEQMDVIIMDAL